LTGTPSPVERIAKMDYKLNRYEWAYEFYSSSSSSINSGNDWGSNEYPRFVLSPFKEYLAFMYYDDILGSDKGTTIPILND